jgi:hypothetical protein
MKVPLKEISQKIKILQSEAERRMPYRVWHLVISVWKEDDYLVEYVYDEDTSPNPENQEEFRIIKHNFSYNKNKGKYFYSQDLETDKDFANLREEEITPSGDFKEEEPLLEA